MEHTFSTSIREKVMQYITHITTFSPTNTHTHTDMPAQAVDSKGYKTLGTTWIKKIPARLGWNIT